MKLKPLCTLLPVLALCACASNPPQTVEVRNPYIAAIGSFNVHLNTVIELPEIVLASPEASIFLPFAHVSVDELPQPPMALFTCGGVYWEPYPIRYWGGLRDIPHIQFTFLNAYQTWVPIEGKVYQHSIYRIGRID